MPKPKLPILVENFSFYMSCHYIQKTAYRGIDLNNSFSPKFFSDRRIE